MVGFNADCLWSINSRLGALCSRLGAPEAGLDMEPLGFDFLSDMIELAMREANAKPQLDDLDL